MKIRVTKHPITMNGLKVPSNRVYINENSFKCVFDGLHTFEHTQYFSGVYYNADAGKDGVWTRCKLLTHGTFLYAVSGNWVKAHIRFAQNNLDTLFDKYTSCGRTHEKAVSPKLDDFRKNREIIRSGCAPLEKRANNEVLPYGNTYYELRKANMDNADFGNAIGTDTPCYAETGKTTAVVKPPKKKDYKPEKPIITVKKDEEIKIDTSQNPKTLPPQPGPDKTMTPEEFRKKFGMTPEQFARMR